MGMQRNSMEANAKWGSKYRGRLPDSAFLLPKHRKLPYKDAQGRVSLSHVRSALARANQVEDVPKREVDAAVRKAERILLEHGGYEKNMSEEATLERFSDVIENLPVPYAKINIRRGPDLFFTISLDPQADWKYGILENSRFAKFHLWHENRKWMLKPIVANLDVPRIRKSSAKDSAKMIKKLEELPVQMGGSTMQRYKRNGSEPERVLSDVEASWRDEALAAAYGETVDPLEPSRMSPLAEKYKMAVAAFRRGSITSGYELLEDADREVGIDTEARGQPARKARKMQPNFFRSKPKTPEQLEDERIDRMRSSQEWGDFYRGIASDFAMRGAKPPPVEERKAMADAQFEEYHAARRRRAETGIARNPGRTVVDEDAARELVLYTENTGSLWGPGNTQGASIRLNLERKHKKGTLDPSKVPKLFEYLMDTAAKEYAREFASPSEWNSIFTKATRRLAAEEMAEQYLEELGLEPNGYPLPDVLEVGANRWFNSREGNSYHKVYITAKGPEGVDAWESAVEYGGGLAWEKTAKEMLEDLGLIPATSQSLRAAITSQGVDYVDLGYEDVSRKKDL